jgi:DNA-binding MarR family transcriptional regulator
MTDAAGRGRPRRRGTGQADSILDASRALLGVVALSVAPALEELTLTQYRVLVILWSQGPVRTGALAEQTGVHQSTFSRTADRMEAAGWIERMPSRTSRREIMVRISARGNDLVESVMDRRRREVQRILRRADPEQRAAIQAGLETFARLAGEPSDEVLLTVGY